MFHSEGFLNFIWLCILLMWRCRLLLKKTSYYSPSVCLPNFFSNKTYWIQEISLENFFRNPLSFQIFAANCYTRLHRLNPIREYSIKIQNHFTFYVKQLQSYYGKPSKYPIMSDIICNIYIERVGWVAVAWKKYIINQNRPMCKRYSMIWR